MGENILTHMNNPEIIIIIVIINADNDTGKWARDWLQEHMKSTQFMG